MSAQQGHCEGLQICWPAPLCLIPARSKRITLTQFVGGRSSMQANRSQMLRVCSPGVSCCSLLFVWVAVHARSYVLLLSWSCQVLSSLACCYMTCNFVQWLLLSIFSLQSWSSAPCATGTLLGHACLPPGWTWWLQAELRQTLLKHELCSCSS